MVHVCMCVCEREKVCVCVCVCVCVLCAMHILTVVCQPLAKVGPHTKHNGQEEEREENVQASYKSTEEKLH